MDGIGVVLTVPMFFRLDINCLKYAASLDKIIGLGQLCLGEIREKHQEITLGSEFDKLFVFHDIQGSHLILRLYGDGLLTLDLQHRKRELSFHNTASIRALEHKLVNHLGNLCTEYNSFSCPIRRGQTVWPYGVSADERLLEFDYDQLVFETNSTWQNIRIYHSKLQGNALVLDGDSMLGEGDLIYTQTLCCIGQEDYKDKTVLILGGGDGAILHELLKENPRFITMAEIDIEVIKVCRTYLRGACGDSLDQLSGPNYQILIEDCLKVLKDSVQNGLTFDFVINDLTEFPVNKSVQGFDYDYGTANVIMQMSLKVLKPQGKIFIRGNCLSAISYRTKLEQDLHSIGCQFKRKDIYVPSFHEVYCLYDVWQEADFPCSVDGSGDHSLLSADTMKTRSLHNNNSAICNQCEEISELGDHLHD